MLKYLFIVCFSISHCSLLMACDKSTRKEGNMLPIYLLLGQSNMSGMRSIADALPPEMRWPNKNAVIFKDGKWISVSPSSFEVKGFGPEVSFAYEMSKRGPIGIIKVSAGNTTLASEWNSEHQGYLYQQTIKKINEAKKGRSISVKGVMWMQGESDGTKKEDAEAYKRNLEQFIKNIRKASGNDKLTFSVCRVTSPESFFRYTSIVRKAQESIKEPGYKWFNCDGLTKGPDNLHYDTEGIVKLGKLFSNTVK